MHRNTRQSSKILWGDIPNVLLTQIIGGHAPLGFSAHAERDNGTMNLISVGVGY